MQHKLLHSTTLITALAVGGCLSSCIDDNYDLSDIDTTTELKVNNLTVPVNINEIHLDKVIKVNDDDPEAVIKIKKVNGKDVYFFSKEGNFNAEPTNIKKVFAPKPSFTESTTSQIELKTPISQARRKAAGIPEYFDFALNHDETQFEYRVGRDGNPKVDDAILSIANLTLDPDGLLTIGMEFSSQQAAAVASKVEIHDLVLICPEVLQAEYNGIRSKDGYLRIPSVETTDGKLRLDIKVTSMNFVTTAKPNGIEINDGCFDFNEVIGCHSGTLRVYPKPNLQLSQIPANVDFTTHYDLSAFTVSAVSGEFNIEAKFDELQSLYLDDIPDFLAGGETSIAFANPALTLEVNNPVAQYGLACSTGLTLRAIRNNGSQPVSEVLPLFSVGSQATNQFHVVAPEKDAISYITNTTGLTPIFTPFPGLGDILRGNGIPQRIDISFTSSKQVTPMVSGKATNFPLGIALPRIEGKYRFETPLALAEGSKIVYTHTEDGWNDEDVDAIAITDLRLEAVANTDIPAGIQLRVAPVGIDEHGNTYRIPLTNPSEAVVSIPANADNKAFTLVLKGDIRHLDGIYFEAVADDFDGSSISPEQIIKLSDLKVTVNGTYIKKL